MKKPETFNFKKLLNHTSSPETGEKIIELIQSRASKTPPTPNRDIPLEREDILNIFITNAKLLRYHYPEGYYCSKFLDPFSSLAHYTYVIWTNEGYTDDEFELYFGGEEPYIWDMYRPSWIKGDYE
jgi:hypothetical protein